MKNLKAILTVLLLTVSTTFYANTISAENTQIQNEKLLPINNACKDEGDICIEIDIFFSHCPDGTPFVASIDVFILDCDTDQMLDDDSHFDWHAEYSEVC